MSDTFADLFNVYGEVGGRQASAYLGGLLSRLPAKNMERMAEQIQGAQQQDLQQFISDSPWEELPVWDRIAQQADGHLGGHRDSMLVIDESAFAKQGKRSAGVARQHNGNLGKTDNCQVGVFSALARGTAATLIGARLFLPKEWVADKERCLAAGIPEDQIHGQTKIELARELILQAHQQRVNFRLVAFDSFYGRDQGLLLQVHELGKLFMADIPVDTQLWTSKPQGAARPKGIEKSGAQRADAIRLPTAKAVHVRNAENGPVVVSSSARRVWLWPAEATAPLECWLLRTTQTDGTVKFTLSNAPAQQRLEVLVRWQSQRFFIEQSFKTAKSHCGMADYQVRKYRAWHHHMAMVGVAMLFLLEERQMHAAETPLLSACDIAEIIDWHFRRPMDEQELVATIQARHQRRVRATRSKRRRRTAKIGPPDRGTT